MGILFKFPSSFFAGRFFFLIFHSHHQFHPFETEHKSIGVEEIEEERWFDLWEGEQNRGRLNQFKAHNLLSKIFTIKIFYCN